MKPENDPKNLQQLAAFAKLPTPTISDALDRLGIVGGCSGILPLVPGSKLAGTAFTVRFIPIGRDQGTVGDYLDDVEEGQVVVLDNGGREDCSVWGGIMTRHAKRRGVAGAVIDGACRDIPITLAEGYPVFTRHRIMVTGKGRVQVEGVNIPVTISRVQVKPGDIVVGDDTGIVIIPKEHAAHVLAHAQEIEEVEARIEELIEKGVPLKEARQKLGYHQLQSRR